MNLHHLELFYFVAKHEGITAAVEKMPYGIQQPAVSSQIQSLEKDLGVKLFNRRPFQLTPEGEKLYDYIYPFFSRMGDLKEAIKGEGAQHLRIAASAGIIRHHLPNLLTNLKSHHPDLKLTLTEVEPCAIIKLIEDEAVDLCVSVLQDSYPRGFKTIELIELPMALIIPKSSTAKTLEDFFEANLWDQGKTGKTPLVLGQPSELLVQNFHQELSKRSMNWTPSLQVSTQELVRAYSEKDFGVGLTVVTPGIQLPETHKYFLLKDFPPLKIGILHRGKLKAISEEFITRAKHLTERLK